MLGKLIKNDMKSTVRSVMNIYIAAFIATAAMGISLFTGFGAGKVVSTVALMIISFIAVIITIVSMFSDFKKTMFGDRGYLTNTLPVKAHNLMFSKWLTAIIWIGISLMFMIACLALVYTYYWDSEGAMSYSELIDMLLEMLGLPSKAVLVKFIFLFSLKTLFWLAVNVMVVYFSLILSNVKPFQSLGGIGVILFFFVIFGIINLVGNKLAEAADMSLLIFPGGNMGFSIDKAYINQIIMSGGARVSMTQIYFEVIAAIMLFIGASELIEKKINVK